MPTDLTPDLAQLSGPELLDALAVAGRWDVLHAMWRSGTADVASAAGQRLVTGPPEIVDHVARALIEPVTGQPISGDVEAMLDGRQCTPEMASRILETIEDVERRNGTRRMLWLLEQPGPDIDKLALDVVEDMAATEKLRRAAAKRCGTADELRAGAVARLHANGVNSEGEWNGKVTLAEELLSHGTAAGADDLVRGLLRELLSMNRSAKLPDGFIRRLCDGPHLAFEALANAAELPAQAHGNGSESGGVALALALMGGLASEHRSTLAFLLAREQPTIWGERHRQLTSPWDAAAWNDFLARVPTESDPGGALRLMGVLGGCPSDGVDPAVLVAAVVHSCGPELDGNECRLAADRVRAGAEADDGLWAALHYPESGADAWAAYRQILKQAISDATHRAQVVGELIDAGHVETSDVVDLLEQAQLRDAFEKIGDPDRARTFVAAVVEAVPVAAAEFSGWLRESFRLDLAEVLAEHGHPAAAFGSVEEHWRQLPDPVCDRVVELLDEYGTAAEAQLLAGIVGDTSGRNRARRERAALRWAALVPEGTPFPPGIATLMTGETAALVRTMANVAATVRPADQETLQALREHWVSEEHEATSQLFRDALDAIDATLARELHDLDDQALVSEGPRLCDALGITAGTDGFEALIRLVGPAARDGNVGLRRAAAQALDRYFAAHPATATPDMIERLAELADPDTGELDQDARRSIGAALYQARLGDDAALTVLDGELGRGHNLGDLLGDEKAFVVRSLNQVAALRGRGAFSYSALVQQLDNVAHYVARAAYLAVGVSPNLKEQIKADPAHATAKPEYGRVLDSLGKTLEVTELRKLHDLRCDKSGAHAADSLTTDDVAEAEAAFGAGIALLHQALNDASHLPPRLTAVEDPPA